MKGLGRLRTKASSAGTRGPHALVYGYMGFGMVSAGKRCRSRSAAAGPISAISYGVRLLAALVFVAGMPCAWHNFGKDICWVVGQDTMGVTVIYDEPCRIMACSPGLAVSMMAVRGAGTSVRTFR